MSGSHFNRNQKEDILFCVVERSFFKTITFALCDFVFITIKHIFLHSSNNHNLKNHYSNAQKYVLFKW